MAEPYYVINSRVGLGARLAWTWRTSTKKVLQNLHAAIHPHFPAPRLSDKYKSIRHYKLLQLHEETDPKCLVLRELAPRRAGTSIHHSTLDIINTGGRSAPHAEETSKRGDNCDQ